MNVFLLELLAKHGVKSVKVKGKDTEEYGHIVPVEFPEIDITTEDGRQQVTLNCDSVDEVTEIYVNGSSTCYTLDTICSLIR